MSRAEKYLPFILAAFAPALSFLNNPEDFLGLEWTTFVVKYIQTSAILLIFWYLNRWLINSKNRLKNLIGQEASILVVNFLIVGIIGTIHYYNENIPMILPLWLVVFRLVLVVLIFNVILRVFKAQSESAELKHQNLSLKAENLTFQIETLKQQINPHFLFNSLNTLLDLIEEDRDSAVEYVRNFSKIYRTVLQSTRHDMIPLRDELSFLKEYWHLLKVRFCEAIDLRIQVSDQILDHMIPPLSLQFLVENAVKHNEASIQIPLIILIEEKDNALIVSNKINKKEYPAVSEKIGLKNLQERFTMLSEAMEFGSIDGKFIVKIPLKSI